MPFLSTCPCGASFNLKDEYAGKLLQCPTCKQSFTAAPPVPMASVAQADRAFERDRFLLRQKVMSINEKYDVMDEQNRPVVFVERPAHLLQNLGALLAGILTALVVIGGCGVVAMPFKNSPAVVTIIIAVGVIVGVLGGIAVGIALSALRHVTFYRDATKTEKLLDVLQDKKFQPINATFTVRDRDGQVLCKFHKNVLYNFFRKRWYCYAPDGSTTLLAMEDSIILSLLRRFLGPMYGLLRTNFIFVPPGSEQVIGEFNRKATLFDRYVLDLSMDPTRTLDRRVALALGVMLDTAERR
jgi:uncharacterized protein YxjI